MLFLKNLRGEYVPYCWERKRCVELKDAPVPFNPAVVTNKEFNDVLSNVIEHYRYGRPFATVEVQGDTYLYDQLTPIELIDKLRTAGLKLEFKKFEW